jgi:plasmid stabilization system protein ParE
MSRVFFTQAAQADLADALQWYEAHAPQMVPHFRTSLRAVVERIGANPQQFPLAWRQTRRALLRRFPYLVIFRETDDAAYVVAVFHTSRDPRIWELR